MVFGFVYRNPPGPLYKGGNHRDLRPEKFRTRIAYVVHAFGQKNRSRTQFISVERAIEGDNITHIEVICQARRERDWTAANQGVDVRVGGVVANHLFDLFDIFVS